MMGVIGIDADRRRLAVVRHVGNSKVWFTIDRFDDTRNIQDSYTRALGHLMDQARGKAIVFLEDCFLRKKADPIEVDRFRVLANVQGEILYEAARHGVEVRRVPPKDWQLRVLGFCKDREAIKVASGVEARKMLNSWNLSEHESDAACLCLYGRWVLRNEAGAA